VTWWIRGPAQLDYIAEPDLFHDLFGHVSLLTDPVFADFMQAYGNEALKASAIGPQALTNLARLYWYTVEFGLLRTDEGLRIYGSGIVSSRGESIHCLDSPGPNRLAFDLERVMRTQFLIDRCQPTYFVIDGFGTLFQSIQRDLRPLYARLAPLPAYPAETLLPSDSVIAH
jgi:phenylalanine-4-hydroxylase